MSDNRSVQTFAKFTHALANLERTMTLPEDNEDYRNSAILAFLLAQETAWKAIKWVLKNKIAIEVAGPKPVLQEAFLQGWLGNDDRYALIEHGQRPPAGGAYRGYTLPEVFVHLILQAELAA